MRELLNILYVTTQGALLRCEHDTVRVEVDGGMKLRAPLLRLSGIVVFGRVHVTSWLIERCADDGRSLVWLDRNGRFRARVEGAVRGNVLLRRAQHLVLSSMERTTMIARQMVAAKIQNSREVLLRGAREAGAGAEREALAVASSELASVLARLRDTSELDVVRGLEGEAARSYFGAFDAMVRGHKPASTFDGRTRRPPRDRVNAILSFLYALLRTECEAALETAGLDPQVGYLHALRPGRPALALDIMEDLRPLLADRVALTLINRRQIQEQDFEELPGGAIRLRDDARRDVLIAYQKAKEREVTHRVVKQRMPLGLVPHVQARLLARHLRGDLNHYPPFTHH